MAAEGLDRHASNEVTYGVRAWSKRCVGQGACLELRMNPFANRGVQSRLRQSERCPLCGREGNWFHMCSMCRHKDMSGFYSLYSQAQRDRTNLASRGQTGETWEMAHYPHQFRKGRRAGRTADHPGLDAVSKG
eukprot:7530641-Pyramimonas_sp.AAC.1